MKSEELMCSQGERRQSRHQNYSLFTIHYSLLKIEFNIQDIEC